MLKRPSKKKVWFRAKASVVVLSLLFSVSLPPISTFAIDANPIEKAGYTLTAQDEFNSPTLDENLWFKWYLPHWTTRDKCEANYSLENGNLVLKITPDMVPWDPDHDGQTVISGIQTGEKDWLHKWSSSYTGNNHHEPTVENHLQKYGYFEIRAKTQAGSGIHCAWWMIGFQEDAADWSNSKQNSEIDIFEILGRNNANETYFNNHRWNDPDSAEQSTTTYLGFNPSSDFHIYGFEWNETNMKFYVDGVLTKTLNTSVDYPAMTLLGIYEKRAGGWTGSFDSSVPYPKTFTIDYWRAYQRNDLIHYNNEAEHGTLNGQATAASLSSASNGRKAGYIGNGVDNWLKFNNLYTYAAGNYNLDIDYISGENRNLSVQVNGGTPIAIANMNSGGWSTVATKTISVQLNAGNNSIKFYNNTAWAPDIDRVRVSPISKANSATVSATNVNSSYPAANVIDGNVLTTLQSNNNPSYPQYINFNWNTAQTLSRVKIGTCYGIGQGVTNVDVQVSDDGSSNWTTVASAVNLVWGSNNSTIEWKEIPFTQVTGKKALRLKINSANNQWSHYAVNEIDIY